METFAHVEFFLAVTAIIFVASLFIALALDWWRARKRMWTPGAKYLPFRCPTCGHRYLYVTTNKFLRCDGCHSQYLPSDKRFKRDGG